MSDTVTCKYSRCFHKDKSIDMGEAVRVGNNYYHPDCHQTKEDIKQIVDLFKTYINPNPVYSQLQNVIKNIVFTKEMGSDFLLFGLQYYIQHKIPLNYPQGLYYVVQNKDVTQAFKRKRAKQIISDTEIEIVNEKEDKFIHKPLKQIGLESILMRGDEDT